MKEKLVLYAFAVIGLFAASISAQSTAITNVRIVTVSGPVIEKGTVVVRDGLIESVGADARIPADAAVIDATGLTVYPGLIDAASTLGIPAPAGPGGGGMGGPGRGFTATPPPVLDGNTNYPTGLRPEFQAIELFKSGDSQFEAARNAGFTTAVVSGRTGIFPGASLMVNLAGDRVSAMVVKSPASQNISFVTIGGGVYPASLLGTFSSLRQLFYDAKRQQEIEKIYAADPRSIRRPEADPSLTALYPVLDRKMPVVFNANLEKEIVRALNLAKEFNLKAVISGGQEAWKVADKLKAQDAAVLLSLNFPRRTTAASPEADPESLTVLRLRSETPKGPAKLAKAGVKFAFQTGGATNLGDVFANVNRAIEAGLSRDEALKAFTVSAAEIFGVANTVGTIEKGKAANLIVTRGDVFAADRFVKHTVVDGKVFEQKEQPRRPQGGSGRGPGTGSGSGLGTPAVITGAYAITIDIPGQPMTGVLTFNQTGTAFTGTMQTELGTTELKDGKVTGTTFSFAASVAYGGMNMDITGSGTVNGNQISGSLETPQGAVPFSGTKNP